MREIKFRIWDKYNKEMIYSDKGGFVIWMGKPNENNYGDMIGFGKETEETLMQYTGLKDKNGAEIYEGDIVKTHNKTLTVLFEEGRFVGRQNKCNYTESLYSWNTAFEVIGNIHEEEQ